MANQPRPNPTVWNVRILYVIFLLWKVVWKYVKKFVRLHPPSRIRTRCLCKLNQAISVSNNVITQKSNRTNQPNWTFRVVKVHVFEVGKRWVKILYYVQSKIYFTALSLPCKLSSSTQPVINNGIQSRSTYLFIRQKTILQPIGVRLVYGSDF